MQVKRGKEQKFASYFWVKSGSIFNARHYIPGQTVKYLLEETQ